MCVKDLVWTERVGQGEVGGCHPPGGTVVTARGRWVGVTLQVVPW